VTNGQADRMAAGYSAFAWYASNGKKRRDATHGTVEEQSQEHIVLQFVANFTL